jgi:signal transduction histidine kinase
VDGCAVSSANVVGVVQNISPRKFAEEQILRSNEELEHTVRARTAELQESLEDMRTFSFAVAHDLRAPLRAVLGFSRHLKTDCRDQLNEDGRDYIDRVAAAAQHMSELIDALLGLARLTGLELSRERVDLSAMVLGEVQALRAEEPQRIVECAVEEGVFVDADAALIRIVIDNLLRNAWKFTSRHPTARIEFGRAWSAEVPVYYVEDDGAGFADANASKLFVPFRRLHPASEFEGIGIGLATVQRVVQRHGGRIWAAGTPGKGARFNFTLGESAPVELPIR